MKPTLIVLAAGMGSRYGSLKQIDGVGPNNEAIIDYSIYDAIRAGFGKVVFVIRRSIEKEFTEIFNQQRFKGRIEIAYAFQELDLLPDGYSVPEGRVKPWGTNHAILAAKEIVKEPFAVINADDFYGSEAYATMANYLKSVDGKQGKYSMIGYNIENTLSDFGTVTRGICDVDNAGNLTTINERFEIERNEQKIVCKDSSGAELEVAMGSYVSMNFFGFTPDYFAKSWAYFAEFLSANISDLKSEFFIPLMASNVIERGMGEFRVLECDSSWFGVTFKEDKPEVIGKIEALIDSGKYPKTLW